MFTKLNESITDRDFDSYFRDSMFLNCPELKEYLGEYDAGRYGGIDGTNAITYGYSRDRPRKIFSRTEDCSKTLYVPLKVLRRNINQFSFPKLGYFSCGRGYVFRASISPQDQLRRGYCAQRIVSHLNEDSRSVFTSLMQEPKQVPVERSFLFLSAPDRFTPWEEGIERMFSGERDSFVPNRHTAVTLSSSPRAEDYPIRVWHKGVVVAVVDKERNIRTYSGKVDSRDQFTRTEDTNYNQLTKKAA